MSAELVGPLQPVGYAWPWPWKGPRVVHHVPPLPRDTRDPRWMACLDHRTACDCREAEHAEQLNEYAARFDSLTRAAQAELAGHLLRDYSWWDEPGHRPEPGTPDWQAMCRGDGPRSCQCAGCRLIRASDESLWCDLDGLVLSPAQCQAIRDEVADRDRWRRRQVA